MVKVVSITSADAVADAEGKTLFDAGAQDMLLIRVQFPGTRDLQGDQVDAWWARVRVATHSSLKAYLTDPSPPTPYDERLGDLSVMFPIHRGLLNDTSYDVVGEIFPEIGEAAMLSIRHAGGDHSTCYPDAPCRVRQRVRPSA